MINVRIIIDIEHVTHCNTVCKATILEAIFALLYFAVNLIAAFKIIVVLHSEPFLQMKKSFL